MDEKQYSSYRKYDFLYKILFKIALLNSIILFILLLAVQANLFLYSLGVEVLLLIAMINCLNERRKATGDNRIYTIDAKVKHYSIIVLISLVITIIFAHFISFENIVKSFSGK